MSGLLADVFSFGDTLKRKARGLLDDPMGTLTQYINNENDRAGRFNQLTAEAAQEGAQAIKQAQSMVGPKSQQLAGLLADAYSPIGMTSIKPLADEIANARLNAMDRVIDFGDGRIARITPRRNSFGPSNLNADLNLSNAASNSRATYPAGTNFQSNQVSSYLASPHEIDKVRAARGEVSAAKTNLYEYMQAQRALLEQVDNLQPPVPSWAQELTSRQNSSPAGADWWNKATKGGEWKSMQAFADAAKDTGLMKFGSASQSKSAEDIAKHYGLEAVETNGGLLFKGENGALQVFEAGKDAPFIRSIAANSSGKESGGGNKLYQAAMNWAANNGKVFAADPAGITPINEVRKLGNELSSQIRNGVPTASMNSPGISGVSGLGDVWQAESKLARSRVPAIKGLSFDGASFNMNDGDIIKAIASKDPNFSKGVGLMTAKRSAIAEWIKTNQVSPDAAKMAAAALAASGSGSIFAQDQ